MKRLSIIVPIFNVEPYVERCILSLVEQDIPENNYEIICINDGSTDRSREVVKNIQKEFNNIIVIDQENKGVSVARNTGIDYATGSYMLMIDADDYIKPNALKEKLDILDIYDLDVGLTGFTILDNLGKEEYRFDPLYYHPINVTTGITYFNSIFQGKSGIREPHRSWAIFIKTNFLNSHSLKYLPGVPYLEDGEFIVKVACLAKRVAYLHESFYIRTSREGSATKSNLYYSEKARRGFIQAANNLLEFRNGVASTKEQKAFLNQTIVHFTLLSIISIQVNKYFRFFPGLRNALKKGPLKKLQIEGCSLWYKNMGRCYNLSIHCFYFYWMLFKLHKAFIIRIRKIFND